MTAEINWETAAGIVSFDGAAYSPGSVWFNWILSCFSYPESAMANVSYPESQWLTMQVPAEYQPEKQTQGWFLSADQN